MTTQNRRVLALMPHPDDMEILCAGTLIRLRDLGWEVHAATMTAGDKGSATLACQEIAAVRREEARHGALVIGAASYTCLEFADLEIHFDSPSRHRVAHILRKIDPALIFTTSPEDYMADHVITSQLVRDACFNAAVKNYETEPGDIPAAGIPTLYYCDTLGGIDLFGNPTRLTSIVDISAQMALKSEALSCHASQREWLRKQHGMDEYVEAMQRACAIRGKVIGTDYAEGFTQHRGHPYPADDLLMTLLNAFAA